MLTAYLVQAKRVRAEYFSLRGQIASIEKHAHNTADSSWPAAGKKIERLSKKLYAVTTDWATIPPPQGLGLAAHRAYGKSIYLNQKYWQLEAYCLVNKRDMSDYSAYGKQLIALNNKANDAFEQYRLALTVRARQLGVKIPWKWSLR